MVQGLASGSVGSWHEVPRTSLAPSSAWLRLLRGRRPWVQGLRSASVGAEQTSPGRLAVSAPLRSAQSRHPPDVLRSPLRFGRRRADIPRMSCGLRSASVGAEQTSPGCLAPHLPQGFGCCGAGAHGSRSPLCTPSSALKWGKLNYTDFVQNCILDQKERTSL